MSEIQGVNWKYPFKVKTAPFQRKMFITFFIHEPLPCQLPTMRLLQQRSVASLSRGNCMAFPGFIKARERPQRTGEERIDKAPQNPGGENQRTRTEKNRGTNEQKRETKGDTVVILQHALDFVFSSSSRAPSSAATAPETVTEPRRKT